MITREEFKNLVTAGANIVRTIRAIENINNLFDAENEDAKNVLTEVFKDKHFEELMNAVGELTASYDLHNAFDELVEVAENLKTECHCMGGVVKSTYLDAVSATAFDEKNGEQYADLLTNWIMTGHGIEEVNALEKEMDADEIYWVRRTL